MMSTRSEPLLDVREAAALAGRAPETIRRWVWAGRLPAQRQGRKLLVARADVLRLATGPVIEVTDLEGWHRRALAHLRATAGISGDVSSSAELVLSDRQTRESADGGDGAGR